MTGDDNWTTTKIATKATRLLQKTPYSCTAEVTVFDTENVACAVYRSEFNPNVVAPNNQDVCEPTVGFTPFGLTYLSRVPADTPCVQA